MIVKSLIDFLSNLDADAEVCALIYDKSMFDFEEDDELVLTNEAWGRVVKAFDEAVSDKDIWDSLSSACLDEAEFRKEDNS
jgi:hypothetical protein